MAATMYESIGFVAVGLILLKLIHSFWKFVFEYFVAQMLGLTVDLKKMGKWAVVTGATDGIGKEYAKQLACRGLNVVIIGRNQEKLNGTESEIKKASGGQSEILIIKADYTHTDGLYEMIGRELDKLDIGILVNNVGMSYPYPDLMMSLEHPDRLTTDMLNVNSLSALRMSQLVLGQMISKSRGLILNVSSAAANRPMPMWASYSATKAYVKFLSECLHHEYKSKGVIIQCVLPYYVCSKMSGLRRSSLFTPLPETFVKSHLNSIGHSAITNGYWPHHIQDALFSLLPNFLYTIAVMKISKGIKAAYLKKLAKKQ